MKTADARQGPKLAWFGREWLNRPARRRRLPQADVRAVFLVIGDIFAPQPPEVLIARVYVWSLLFAEDRTRVHRYGALEEAGDPRLRGD